MRVYELGRSLGRSNQEIMKILTRNGIRVTSHMSVLEENQIEMVRKTVEANEKSKMENHLFNLRRGKKLSKKEFIKNELFLEKEGGFKRFLSKKN